MTDTHMSCLHRHFEGLCSLTIVCVLWVAGFASMKLAVGDMPGFYLTLAGLVLDYGVMALGMPTLRPLRNSREYRRLPTTPSP